MLDIDTLERRWLKYKIKTYFPYILGSIVVISALTGSVLWMVNEPAPVAVSPALPKITTPQTAKIEHPKKPVAEESATVLEPSMDFVQSFQNQDIPQNPVPSPAPKTLKTPAQSTPALSPPKVLNVPNPPSTPVIQSTPSIKKSESTLTISRNESKLDIEELQARFKETSNANLGLFITRYYYDHGNYSEAYNYALKTNAVNSKIDESWILFSKSLVKLGKSDQAKKTLQLYISQSNSEEAKELLNGIEKGNFK